MGPPPLQPHEIEGLRRSLAIGNGLPADQVQRLLETCDALMARASEANQLNRRVRTELDALRPVVAELRARLTSLLDAAPAAPPGGRPAVSAPLGSPDTTP